MARAHRRLKRARLVDKSEICHQTVMTQEIELKFLLAPAEERRLRAAAAAEARGGAKAREIRLKAVYFDTPERALSSRRIALRVRKEGRRWVQTVKAGGGLAGGLSMPRESECAAPGGRLSVTAIPDPALRSAVAGALDGRLPAPVFETDIRRTAWTLSSPLGGAVEVAVDVGEIRAAGRAEPIREVEIELKRGDPRDLYAVAKRLFPAGPVRFSRRNKAERGFAVAAGLPAVAPVPEPVGAAPVALTPGQTTESAAHAVLRLCLDQIAGNVAAAALSDDAEGPHQLRVGLRRFRTAAAVFRDALGGPALDALSAEARSLAAAVGAVRDLDVLAGEAAGPLVAADPGFDALLAALGARREDARAAMRARLAAPATVGFLFDLGAFVEARGWVRPTDFDQSVALAAPVSASAGAALDRAWRKAAKLGRAIETLGWEERHELRKRLKKLRYAVEFFAGLYAPRKAEPFLKLLRKLQDDFGALQDVAMARAALTGQGAPGAGEPAAQRAVGYLLGRREAEAEHVWGHAQAHWRDLAGADRFWR
jgi:inorganic triphosphatase YgiF